MIRHSILMAAIAVAAALPATASAGPAPVPGGTGCSMEAKRTYRHGAVLRPGVPVRVTCDGPARLMVFLDFSMTSAAQRWVGSHLYPDSDPGMEAFTRGAVVFDDAGSRTVRLRFWPWAQRVAAKFPRTLVKIHMAVEREDGSLVSVPGAGQRTMSTLVR
jgi:hypothetical protein